MIKKKPQLTPEPRPAPGKSFICNPCGKPFTVPAEAPKEWADWARADGVSPCCGATYLEGYPEWPEPKRLSCSHFSHEGGGPDDYGPDCRLPNIQNA